MLDELLDLLRSSPEVAARMPDPVQPALIRSGPASRRLVAFLFAGNSLAPALFVKLASESEDRPALRHEHANLQAVAAIAGLAGSVPEPLAVMELPDKTVSVQSGLPGTSFAAVLRRRLWRQTAADDLSPALLWLEHFQQLTTTGSRPAIEPVTFSDRISRYLPEPAHEPLRGALLSASERLAEVLVPAVRRHGDFWPGNVMCHGARVGVVDWEHSDTDRSPMQDMFMLVTTYASLVPGPGLRARNTAQGFEAAWLGEGRLAAQVSSQARAFLLGLGVEPSYLEVLLVDFLLEMIQCATVRRLARVARHASQLRRARTTPAAGRVRGRDRVKVLVVIDSLGLGGAENLLAVLGRAAPTAGIEMHVACLTPQSMGRTALQSVMEEAGLTTSFLDIPRLLHPSGVRRIAREIRLRDADVVHAHLGYSAILAPVAARAVGRGSVATLHHVPQDLPLRERVKERLSLEVSARLGALVLVSDASRKEFAARYAERDSWVTVYNGVDLSRFQPGPRRPLPSDLGIPPGAPVVTIVAALRQPKGHVYALEAWQGVSSRFPEARLLIVGEGEEREQLKTSAQEMGVSERVVFAGMRQDIPDLLVASSAVLLPSLTEALPTALIEAAACGRPTVATAVGGTAEVVEHGRTGLLVPPADSGALGGALTRLLADEALRERMGRQARELAESRFDADLWALRLRAIYDAEAAARNGSFLRRARVGARSEELPPPAGRS